jgi:hypothetical protein
MFTAQFTQKDSIRCYSATHKNLTGTIQEIKATQTGRNAFIILSLNYFQQVVHLYFLWGLPNSKGVCLPFNDESCGTQAI